MGAGWSRHRRRAPYSAGQSHSSNARNQTRHPNPPQFLTMIALIMTDLRFALRQLSKSPGFTVLAVITLTLGIGLNTAIFSLVDELFLRGLPFPQSTRIVHIYGEIKGLNLTQLAFSIPRYWHYRDGQTVFTGLAADGTGAVTLTGLGDPVQINAAQM